MQLELTFYLGKMTVAAYRALRKIKADGKIDILATGILVFGGFLELIEPLREHSHDGANTDGVASS